MYASIISGQASATTSSTLCVPPLARLVPKLGGYAPNHYSTTTRVVSASFLARGLSTNNYSTWLLPLTWWRARGLNTTSVLRWWLPQTLKTLGLILQSFQGSGAAMLHPSFKFFQDRRFGIKIGPQLESATQPKARGLRHMEWDFATALPYKSRLQD
jgi:hypothetical protein